MADYPCPSPPPPNPHPQVPKAHLNKHLRRQVAQLQTVARERSIKDGLGKREARKIELFKQRVANPM